MAISSASLFHFTGKLDYLQSIIENGFHPRYSMESIKIENRETGKPNILKKAYPMVCFCDIPLSQVKDHIGHYGNYGLGLNKEWGKEKGLNPILYLGDGSLLSKHLIHLASEIFNEERNGRIEDENIKKMYHEVMRYVKLYSGVNFDREGNEIRNYRFYNEREWRFVPEIIGGYEIGDIFLKEKQFNDDKFRKQCNDRLSRNPLQFETKDISYIIVQHDFEVMEMITVIEKCKKFSAADAKLLTTKLQTIEQIMNDF